MDDLIVLDNFSSTDSTVSLSLQLTPFVGSAIGITLAFAVTILFVVLTTRHRWRHNHQRYDETRCDAKTAIPLRISDTDETYVDLRIKKPRTAYDGIFPFI